MWLYALTIFLSAFLLFQVQPMMGKWILPWFGGGPAVWTTCLLFFQSALVAGYGYAHLVRTGLRGRGQMIVHLVVLAGALVFLPIAPWNTLKPPDGSYPTWRVLLVLLAAVGLPYFVLSTTSPLVQVWFSVAKPGRSPYVLYSLSNLGSLLALASYPFVIEPLLRLRYQSWIWSTAFVAFAVLCAACAVRAWRKKAAEAPVNTDDELQIDHAAADATYRRPGFLAWVLWLALPACGSTLLMAVTNQMCSDVSPIPFLWILPFALYLLSFILVFFDDRIYQRLFFWPLLLAAAVVILCLLYSNVNAPMLYQIVGYNLALFVCCMVCHGELAKLRPHPRHLTAFYLLSAVGGALGGVFVVIVAPQVFTGYFELHVGLWLCFVLAAVAFWYGKAHRDRSWWPVLAGLQPPLEYLTWVRVLLMAGGVLGGVIAAIVTLRYFPHDYKWYISIWSGVALATIAFWYGMPRPGRSWWPIMSPMFVFLGTAAVGILGGALFADMRQEQESAISVSRNFYGVLQVLRYDPDDPDLEHYSLQHGRILHGSQYTAENLREKPATYYGPDSGVGRAVLCRRPGEPLKIGVVGLGTGTMAAYGGKAADGRPDTVRFYEINTAVLALSDAGTVYGPDGKALNAAASQSIPSQFTYIKDARARGAQVEIALGDARLSLEREPSQQFDVLALDAFTSDAIPVHLLTLEAVEVYRRHLKPDGVLAVHISNRFLDLRPVVLAVAEATHMNALVVDDPNESDAHYLSTSVWVLLTDDQKFLLEPGVCSGPQGEKTSARCLWTDDYSNLLRVIRWSTGYSD